MRRMVSAALAAVLFLLVPAAAVAQEVVLRMHSFSTPQAPEGVHMILPFIERVNEESNGRLKIELYPSMQLGGKPSDLPQQLADGVVDFIVLNTGVAPGRFSGLEGMDLPFTGVGTPEGQTAAVMEYANKWLLDKEFAGIKIIHMHAAEGSFFTRTRPLRKIEDFQGMSMRAPGRFLGEAIGALGATPVATPITELYESLERGQLDGTAVNWPIVAPYRLYEVTKYNLATPVYQNMIMVLMRQASYDALPDDLKKVIDSNIDLARSQKVAAAVDAIKQDAIKLAEQHGNEVYTLTDEERQAWIEAVKPAYQLWIEEMNSRGMPGQEMFDDIAAITAKHRGQ